MRIERIPMDLMLTFEAIKPYEFDEAFFTKLGTEHRVPYAPAFLVLPAGHYVLRELAFDILGKGVGTVAAAVIGVLVGTLLVA